MSESKGAKEGDDMQKIEMVKVYSLHHAGQSKANLSLFVEAFGLHSDDIIRCSYCSFEVKGELPHTTTSTTNIPTTTSTITTTATNTDHMELCITATRRILH